MTEHHNAFHILLFYDVKTETRPVFKRKKETGDDAALVQAEQSDGRENLPQPERPRRSINTNNQFEKCKIIHVNVSYFYMVRLPQKDGTRNFLQYACQKAWFC